jgi:hypothetical protein
MRVCGVELKGSDANICLLSLSDNLFDLPDCRVRRLTLSNSDHQAPLKDFQFAFKQLITDYKVDIVVIRERHTKGKFAGGATGFKMEATIQLAEGLRVELISPSEIKEQLKHNPLPISFNETGLKAFQESAFITAFAYLMKPA